MNKPKDFQFFQAKKCRALQYEFKGDNLSFEGGLLLLRECDEKRGFSEGINACIIDRRNPDYIVHEKIDLIRERLYMITQRYGDCNDARHLKPDSTFKSGPRPN